ncbi:glycosyltransferase [Enterobacteriaceae bacterium BIT-l23]|uniref:glycosyltransferase n=1 Tax=Jejubacter sp. L23 TaxID=3092086 RepID=UPI001584657A|nr:glycosyltransferase [Enterobacteriaceae bacterium BIT-l23]
MYPPKVKVSVIVPVFNVEKYVEKCMDSLLNQTLTDIEIIIVNDGSTDRSGEIVQRYIRQYNNIKYVEQENKGLSEARNAGVRYAEGEYLAFLDSDDWVKADAYEILYNKAIINNDDIVCCGFYMSFENGAAQREYITSKEYNSVEPLIEFEIFRHIKVAAWDKLYNREFFIRSGIRYPAGLWYEDTAVSVPLLLKAKKISVISRPLVYYRQREGSITKQNDFNPKIFDVYQVYECVREHSTELVGHENIEKIYCYFYTKKCVIDNFIRMMSYNHLREYIDSLRHQCRERFSLLDVVKNSLLSTKEKIFALLILIAPLPILVLVTKWGIK